MTNMKKFLFFGCLIVVALLVVGCKGDTVAPVLTIEDPTITHVVNADVDLLEGITATDNTDSAADIVIEISDLGGYDKAVVGTYDVTVKATDKAGNSVTQTITVTVTEVPILDTVAPVLTIGTASITHQTNATVDLLEDVTASDDVDVAADITIEVSDFNGYDKSIAGTYVVTVKATDKSGNFSTGTITVIVKSDILAPMLTSSVSDVIHIAGETVDLTQGLEGVDNVDGVNVIFTVSDSLTYNKEVPGEYDVEITMSDAAGNEAVPFTRHVIVQEGYARAEMTSFEGETIRYEALYNPQVLNGVTGTGYNSAYDGHYVNVLSKEYLEWLLAYAPERIGSGMGWNVIAVTDSSNKIVYVRHWNSGEAYKDEADNLVSIPAVDWCSGTVRTWTETVGEVTVGMSNAKYSAGEMGMMMANINKWVPENGHIFIFMNWTTIGKDANDNVIGVANSADMPRSMGARYIMASDENGDDVMDYALGRDLFILNPELSDQDVRTTFDAANPFPIISVPSSRFITGNGAWKNDYVNVVYLNEHDALNPFNPLLGITADDGKGTDITANVTYKMYRYQTTTLAYGLQTSLPITDPRWEEYLGTENTWKLADNEVTVEQALNPVNDDYYFVVEYQVTANGHTDTAYRLVQIQAETPDYIELYGPTDSVFSETLGIQQRLDMNPNLTNFGAMNATEKGILYTADFFKAQTTLPVLAKGVAVVLDPYYRVQLIRVLNGAAFEMDATGTPKTAELTWTSADMLAGLGDLVPAGGYIVIYPEGLDGAVLLKAMKAFYDFSFVGGEVTDVLPANGGSSVEMIIKEVKEVSTLIVNDVAPLISVNNDSVNIPVIENSKDALVFSSAGGGAGFRLDVGKTYYFTKAQYAILAANAEVVASFTTGSPNKGTPWFRDGVIIVVDADGKFVQARIMTTSAAAEVKADGSVIFGNAACVAGTEADKAAAEATAAANLTWDLVIPNAANTIAHGPLADIQTVVPDGGAFFILPGTTSTAVRNYAIKLVWNAAYPGSGVIVDATLPTQPEGAPNPATNGFDATNMTAAYLAALTFKVQFVSTVTVKAPKIDRPVASIANNVLSWGEVAGAASYDVYVDGVLAAAGVGDLVPDTTTYNYALRLLNLDGNAHDIQVRAIAADPAVGSTSVLSDPVTVQFTALATPENIKLNETVLSWNPVRYAIGYNIYVNDVLFATSLACQFDLVDAFGSSTKYVQIKAIPDPNDNINVASEITEKLPFGEATATYLTLALETQGATYTTVDEWMVKRNVTVAMGGFAGSTQIFVIEDAVNFATYATPTNIVTANGTFLLFAANGTLKAVRTILGKFEWLSTNDPLVTNGWRVVDTYTAGRVYASELAGLVAEGDYIILSNNTTAKQTGAQLNPRDFLAYHFQGSWTLGSTEIWRATTVDTFINPASVAKTLKRVIVTF